MREQSRVDEAYAQVFACEVASANRRVEAIAGDPRFHEATLWQNHGAAQRARHTLAAGDRGDRSYRKAVDLIALQLQRYTTKNETIGFFGPVGWARLSERTMAVELRPGPALIDHREVHFEGWCIDALVERFNDLPGIEEWIAPRVRTGVWCDRAQVFAPGLGAVSLTPVQRRILDLCDGRTTIRELATALTALRGSDVVSADDVSALVKELVQLQLVSWRWEVPSQLHPERDLQTRIAAIPDAAIRRTCVAALQELLEARNQVALSVGHPGKLERALNQLDATFSLVTGRSPVRRGGEMYAARGLVYEDCRRNCELVLGKHFLDRIGPPLSIVLDGMRWAASELARAARQHLRRRHAEMRAATGAAAIDSQVFYNDVRYTSAPAMTRLLGEVRGRIGEAWQVVLGLVPSASPVVRAVADVRPRADEVFRPVGPLWGLAHHISPDVMVAASSVGAFRRGDFHCVIGEVHSANTLIWSSLATQHPEPDALAEALWRDVALRTVVHRQRPKESFLSRGVPGLHCPTHWQYQYHEDVPNHTACRSAPAAMFLAIDDGETVVCRSRDGRVEFDALELFAAPIAEEADQMLKHLLPDVAHVPRITIDGLTIARARWRVHPSEMPFLGERNRAIEFRGVREWARRHTMPQRVFYKVGAERKPCYLDFDSPLYTGIFVNMVRRAGPLQVCIEEMFPDVTDAWLVDTEGARYTCEVRIAASLAPSKSAERVGRELPGRGPTHGSLCPGSSLSSGR